MRFDGSRSLTPSQAFEMGKSAGERSSRTKIIGGTLSEQPDWKIRDHASRDFSWPAGMDMGAHDAFRRGFNEGIGRKVF